jgi:hypothetical protein
MENIHEVGVVIHVDEALSEEQRAALLGNLQKHDGVERARFTKGREHLMVIEYNSDKLHSSDVLDYVRQEHVNAELIII